MEEGIQGYRDIGRRTRCIVKPTAASHCGHSTNIRCAVSWLLQVWPSFVWRSTGRVTLARGIREGRQGMSPSRVLFDTRRSPRANPTDGSEQCSHCPRYIHNPVPVVRKNHQRQGQGLFTLLIESLVAISKFSGSIKGKFCSRRKNCVVRHVLALHVHDG